MIQTFRNRLSFQGLAFRAFAVFFALSASVFTVFSQVNDGRTKNNPYFPSPVAKAKQDEPQRVPATTKVVQPLVAAVAKQDTQIDIRPSVTQQTYQPAKTITEQPASSTDIYRVGVGDVIFINLKNAANSSGYYTVRENGMIDFPLAGEKIVVTGRTANEIAEMLASGITLYPDPRVEVKVREYGSHKIRVSGMVEFQGETSLQREAIPLYVICAQAGVEPKATKALVRRTDLGKVETFDLHDGASDKVLIYPGNSVEFTADVRTVTLPATGSYYVAGAVNSAGQKEISGTMRLSQAVAAAGGVKGNPNKATIRHKTDKGFFTVSKYNLRAIKDGKNPDPLLSPGDMIEITN